MRTTQEIQARLTMALAALLVWSCCSVLGPKFAEAASDPLDNLFSSSAISTRNLKLFPQWRAIMARQLTEHRVSDSCTSGLFSRCDLTDWKSFLATQQGREAMDQLDAVNRYMNRHRYVVDPINWGMPDYWATPVQFLGKNGDCEDYAIAKFISLRDLGWASEAMRVVVVNDLNLKTQHAVLAVSLNGRAYILDNQSPVVMPADSIRHYRAVYSLTEGRAWLHRL